MRAVVINYTNYRGISELRRIRPIRLIFGNNEGHPETQWLLQAEDVDSGVMRTFAMANIHSWERQE